jgi:hypothetical protein
MGALLFDVGTEADSGPDDNRTIAGPLGVKHAPVERHCHDIVMTLSPWTSRGFICSMSI